MQALSNLLQGKRGLVVGIANNKSIQPAVLRHSLMLVQSSL